MISRISVIICTKNRYNDFRNTVSSLMLQNRLPDELVVVDSSETKMLEEFLSSANLPVPFTYIQYPEPGLTRARNVGVRRSKGDLIFFFDDDCDLDVNYLARVEAVFDRDAQDEVGAVGGRIENQFGNTSPTLRYHIERAVFELIRVIFGLDGFGSGRFKLSGMPTYPRAIMEERFVECLSGGLMAFRRRVFEKAVFDENLPGVGLMEDWAISKSVIDAGYKIYYLPSASIIHNESPQNRLNHYRWAEMTVANYNYLFRRDWWPDWYRRPFYYWALLGLVVINLHNIDALRGTLSGIRKLFR